MLCRISGDAPLGRRGLPSTFVAKRSHVTPPSGPKLSQTNIAGTTATFTVSATGTVPLICQWRFNGATIVGATSSALTLSNVQPNNAGNYNVVITNNAGATTSTVATLTVLVPPSITSQPQSQTNVAGATASFSVGATGTAPLICQWQLNGGTIAGATGTTLTLNNVQPSDAGNYNVVVANSAGATTSAVATLTVLVPPSITTQPQSATNIAGTAAAFSVAANGSVPLSYQWKFNGTDIPGATGATLTLNDVQANDAGNYAVVVTNNVGSVTSIVAALTVLVPPSITTPPLSQTNIAGTNVTFSVTATGTAPLICQWRFNGATIAGATGTSLTLSNLQANDAGNYYVVVTNTVGAATSVVATLTVLVSPSIAGQPQSRTAAVGANATFTVIADGSAPLSYQWLFNGTAVFGATVSSFTRTNLLPADAGNYSVQVTNAAGMAISSNAALSIIEPPAISAQPLSQAVAAGSNVTFTILATGTPPLIYQWQLNGSDIAGATTNAYTRPNAQAADAGSYIVAVTNGAGTVTSDEAILTVNTPPTLAAVSNQTIHAGSTLTVSNSATDIDVPSQTLAFGLDPGAPAGAAIDTNSGVLVWVTRLADAGATNVITVRVTDNGTPSLSDAKSFVITVVAPLTVRSINASNSNITISWEAIPGQAYRVDFKDRLDIIQWSSLAGDVVATSSTASKTDPIGPGQRYYRVRLVE